MGSEVEQGSTPGRPVYFQCGKCSVIFTTKPACLNHGCWQQDVDTSPSSSQAVAVLDQTVLILPEGSNNDLDPAAPVDNLDTSVNQSGARFQWDKDNTSKLLAFLADQTRDGLMGNSSTSLKKKDVFELVASQLRDNGVNVDSVTCHQKWRNLVRSYRVLAKKGINLKDIPHMVQVAAIAVRSRMGGEGEQGSDDDDVGCQEGDCSRETSGSDDSVDWTDSAVNSLLTLLESSAKDGQFIRIQSSSSPTPPCALMDSIAAEMSRVVGQHFSGLQCLVHWEKLQCTTTGNPEVRQKVRQILSHLESVQNGQEEASKFPGGASASTSFAGSQMKGVKWDTGSVQELLRLIRERQSTGSFSGSSKKKAVYADIAEHLKETTGLHVDADACHQKWRNLVRDVKVATTARQHGLNKHCPHYEAVVALMNKDELSRALGTPTSSGNQAQGAASLIQLSDTTEPPPSGGRKRKAEVLEKIYELLKKDVEEERQFRELILLRYEARQDSLRALVEEIQKWA